MTSPAAVADCDEAAARFRARRRRFTIRDEAQALTRSGRVRGCGRAMTGRDVRLVVGPAGAGYAGVLYCGSVWLCAACSAVVRAVRAADIQAAVVRHLAAGGGALFATVTVPHTAANPLAETWPVLSDGWRWAWEGRKAAALRSLLGDLLGNIRTAETTIGNNGWHPHLHVLLLTERPVTEDTRRAVLAKLHEHWTAWCWGKQRWGVPVEGVGVRVDPVRSGAALGAYIAKVQDDKWQQQAGRSVGAELARGDLKRGRQAGRTPFELLLELRELRHAGHSDARQRTIRRQWREFETVSKGRAAVRWSRGLAAALQASVDERDDAQVAAEIQSAGAVVVARFDRPTWAQVCRVNGLRERLLSIAEDEALGGGERVVRIAQELVVAELRGAGEFWESTTVDSFGRPTGYGPPWWWSPACTVVDSWVDSIA